MARIEPTMHTLKGDAGMVLVRAGEPDDAANMLECAREVFATSPYLLTSPDEFTLTTEQERQWITGIVEDPGQLLLLACMQEQVVGILDLRRSIPKRKGRHRVLLGMSVRLAYRGRGVGAALMHEAMGWARAHPQIRLVTLEVYAANAPAIALYRRFGFVERGTMPGGLIHDDGTEWDQVEMYLRV